MVDSVGYAEPAHERTESDTAGQNENGRAVAERLNRAAQPAQELVDPPGVAVAMEHALEEDRQLVDDQEHGFFLRSAIGAAVAPRGDASFRHPDRHGSSH